jgi:hypothetical protein
LAGLPRERERRIFNLLLKKHIPTLENCNL